MSFGLTTDSFVAVTFFVYGVFVTLWAAGELAAGLRTQQMRKFDGQTFAKIEAPRAYWYGIARESVVSAWGVGWSLIGLIELFRPNTFC